MLKPGDLRRYNQSWKIKLAVANRTNSLRTTGPSLSKGQIFTVLEAKRCRLYYRYKLLVNETGAVGWIFSRISYDRQDSWCIEMVEEP